MRITFFIGNGFDLNLGLNTSYSDFIDKYLKVKSSKKPIIKMKKYMKSDVKLWANAELALGEFTGQFKKGKGKKFSKCQKDFCKELAKYLKKQEEKIDYATSEDKIKSAFKQLNNNITNGFSPKEKEVLDAIIQEEPSEGTVIQFICFNYTNTLDKCLEIAKGKNVNIVVDGYKRGKTKSMHYAIEPVCHIHGTADEDEDEGMIFAVDNENQIKNPSIFKCKHGDIYENSLIKKRANEPYREHLYDEANEMLEQSQIVYIYGMSIGESDRLWWNRICNWLEGGRDRHLMIHMYEAPEKGAYMAPYMVFEREQRNRFLDFGNIEDDKRIEIGERIHITGYNLFEKIRDIV